MSIAITGCSGLIGTALSRRLRDEGREVVPVVRRIPGDNEIGWSIKENRIDTGAFDGFDAVVHLAGAGIGDHRWTASYKLELVESRTVGTALVAEAVRDANDPPSVLLSASAVGFYGASQTKTFDENDGAGDGFLADLCASWEEAATSAQLERTRVVLLRTGVVMAADGGALKKQLPLFKFGLGGRMGKGTHWQSWISIDDVVGAIMHLLANDLSGAVNLTAPNPVTNAEFTRVLGSVLGRPTALPIPTFGPTLLLGRELANNLLFSGQRVLPNVLLQSGYEFVHPELEEALRALLQK